MLRHWRNKYNIKIGTTVLSLCLVGFFIDSSALANASRLKINYEDGRLTLRANNAPLLKVLEEVSKVTQIDISVADVIG